MKWSAVNIAPARAANHKWRRRSPAVVSLGDHVGNLVEGAPNEVHKLELGYRTHSGKRRPERRADNRGFRNRRVNDALGTEAADEAVGDFECPAVDTDVLANAEDAGIAFHFFPNALADGFEIGELRH